ncbi:MAG: proline--tRNA ligase [Rickettsiales bacterium]|nr:MAG: proline--tRNA ligase [Rickettsiales bacterium]
MLLSQYFLPVLKEQPSEAQVASHSLMLKAGMIRQSSSGIYSWLPLGLKVLRNIENIIRFNMDASGFVEILMPCVQDGDLWRESGRLDVYGEEMLRFKDRHGHDLLFGPTNEEVITDIIRNSIQSYRDLPKVLYQIQWKFRDEIRPRFGVMRGREFLMKDAYSIDLDEESAIKTYDQIFAAYMRTFKDLGLNVIPLAADSGEIGGSMSHEFHVVAETGESKIYYDKKFDIIGEDLMGDMNQRKSLYAATEEKHDPKTCPIPESELSVKRGIEVGHIFNFADKYSKPMKAMVNDNNGKQIPVHMGAYGIGVSRLVAAIIESSHDDKGIIWPISVAPFKVSVINVNIKDELSCSLAGNIYNMLRSKGIDVLYDDTNARTGAKFATHDLIGSPWQIIVGPKKAASGLVELKHRASGEVDEVSPDEAILMVVNSLNVK